MIETTPYAIGQQLISLPAGHPLPDTQRNFPLYERFPFFLATICDKDEWIIDVGANIGDTTTAFIQATEGSVLAVEGHPGYAQFLEMNVRSLSPHLSQRIKIVRALVGTGRYSGALFPFNGSASLADSGSGTKPRTMDDILASMEIAPESVALFKTDTDGYDADVILSGAGLLTGSSPVLYFENQIANQNHFDEFLGLYRALDRMGYKNFWLIDNFGNPLVDQLPAACLASMARYLHAHMSGRTDRTIYYYDVVACQDEKMPLVHRTICTYREFVDRGPKSRLAPPLVADSLIRQYSVDPDFLALRMALQVRGTAAQTVT